MEKKSEKIKRLSFPINEQKPRGQDKRLASGNGEQGNRFQCTKCKSLLQYGDKFCLNCGTEVQYSLIKEKEHKIFDIVSNLNFQIKYTFYEKIWNQGAYQRDLVAVISSATNEQIDAYAQFEQEKGFVSIIEIENPSHQNERFYFISDENFSYFYLQICNKAKIPHNPELCQELLYYKNNLNSQSLEVVPLRLGGDDRINKIHNKLLEKWSPYLLLYILKANQSIMNQRNLNNFITNAIVKIITVARNENDRKNMIFWF